MTVKNDVPYFSQTKNLVDPTGSCGSTSLTMALKFFGVKGEFFDNNSTPDDVTNLFRSQGLDTGSPEDIRSICTYLGLSDELLLAGTLRDIYQALNSGFLVIAHGYFTPSGHILLISGYDGSNFIVNDPNGEWFSSGYQDSTVGKDLTYSARLIVAACSAFSYEDFINYYTTFPSLVDVSNMWLHIIGK